MLNLIIGRTGYGKTEYIYSKISEMLKNGANNLFLLTPEQFSFVSERRLLEQFGESNVSKIENSNFSKLYQEVSRVYGGNDKQVLSSGGKAIMMKCAIDSVRDSLKIFANYKESSGFVNSMISINDELKSCGITYDSIEKILEEISNPILSDKLSDIAMISSAYQSLISSDYFDSADDLSRLYKKLEGKDYFNNRTVFIDGFTGFVETEFDILKLIFKDAKDIYITFCTDEINDNENGFGVFSHTKDSIKDILNLADTLSIEKNVIKLDENKRAKNADLLFLEKNLYSRKIEETSANGDITLFCASDIVDECDYVSRNIKSLLRNEYCRAKDIAVVCRDSNLYNDELIASFKKFEVPFFDDQRQSIACEPLISFVEFLLRTVVYSFKTEDILSLIKTGLFGFSIEEITELENYVLMWNINGSKWFKDFDNSPRGFSETMNENDIISLENINKTRKSIIKPLLDFRDITAENSGKGISEAIYNFLIKIGADKELKSIAQILDDDGLVSLSQQQGKIWDLTMEILNQLAITLDKGVISVKEYAKLFSIVVSFEDIGIIPQGLDNVQFGQADRIRLSSPKVVFVIGCSEGDFPKSLSNNGMLNEKDRKELFEPLSSINAKLYSFGENLVIQEKYFAYMACCCATDKVFVSYSANVSGIDKMPSYIFSRIKSMFENIEVKTTGDILGIDLIESTKSAFEVAAKSWNEKSVFSQSLKEYFKNDEKYSKTTKIIDTNINDFDIVIENKTLAKELFNNDMIISASRIEDFYNCSFRYFCKFGLGAKTRQTTKLDAMQTGTLIHFVLENIVKECGSSNLSNIEKKERHSLAEKYLNEYFDTMLGNSSEFTSRFTYQFKRLSTLICDVVDRLALEFENCSFEAKAFEMKVDKDGQVDMPIIELDDGGTIKIRGSIDRVDTYSKDGTQYVRVIDYKSGSKHFALSDILYGINLQMFVYLFALCNDEKQDLAGVPSGVLYMHSARQVVNINNRNTFEQEVENQENKDYKMIGVVLDDGNVINAMDSEVSGRFVPVKVKSSGELTGDIVSLSDMGKLSKKIAEVIKRMGESLHNGLINPYPINGTGHDKTCEFCDYSTVCMYKQNIEKREMEKMSNEDVLLSIGDE